MTAQDWLLIIAAIGTLVGTVTAAALRIIAALKENTAVTVANTLDREVKTATTQATLAEIGSQVRDLHAGTGAGTTTVIMPPAPEPPPTV